MPFISAPSRLLVLALPVSHPDPTLAGQSFWLVVCRRDQNLPTRVSVDSPSRSPGDRRSLDPGRGPIPEASKSSRCGAPANRNWRMIRPRLHAWEHRRRLLLPGPPGLCLSARTHAAAVGRHEGLGHALLVPSHRGSGPVRPSYLSRACAPPSVSSGSPFPLPSCSQAVLPLALRSISCRIRDESCFL
jgi:hypothetical protein